MTRVFVCRDPDPPHSSGSGLRPGPPDSDEALALRLQRQLDREAAEAQTADLEDRGLFFCQICQRDLSRMTPEGRAQHLNRFGLFFLLNCLRFFFWTDAFFIRSEAD